MGRVVNWWKAARMVKQTWAGQLLDSRARENLVAIVGHKARNLMLHYDGYFPVDTAVGGWFALLW